MPSQLTAAHGASLVKRLAEIYAPSYIMYDICPCGTAQTGSISLNPSPAEQQQALASAMAQLLWQARSGSAVSVALLPDHDSGARLSHEQLVRGATFVSVTQRAALEVRPHRVHGMKNAGA